MHVRLQAGIALGIPVDHWGVVAIRGANNTRRVVYGQNKEVDPVAYQFVESRLVPCILSLGPLDTCCSFNSYSS